MTFSSPVIEIIQRRTSCRRYSETPVDASTRQRLAEWVPSTSSGPLRTPVRLLLALAGEAARQGLRGLGTYGFIQHPTGFIIGAVGPGAHNLEDFGYVMELSVLAATDLGLATCWLGGSFTRSRFARRIAATQQEIVPAVVATGYPPEREAGDWIRRLARGDSRLPWEQLFFDGEWGRPLTSAQAGEHAVPLEMVRVAPSASNKQPWRIVRIGGQWHFCLLRTPRYPGSLATRVLGIADLQRVDMGIAMCHFGLACAELGLPGRWEVLVGAYRPPAPESQYIVSWVPEAGAAY